MKLLFIQGGSRWKFDINGNVYTDANFNEKIWDRYRKYCDRLTVLLRCEDTIYEEEDAQKKFNVYDTGKSDYVSVPDLYRPVSNFCNPAIRSKLKNTIKEEVKKADIVIIRSISDIYTNLAVKYAKKYKKLYMIEVTTFIYESLWYHSVKGKIIAYWQEKKCKKAVAECDYVSYVTEKTLQERYPGRKYMLGCSDVELPSLSEDILIKRYDKINGKRDKIILGTAAFLDVEWKGQKYVIQALYKLKKRGITDFEYHMIGSGTGEKLYRLIKKLNMQQEIKIIGALEHEKVFEWLDNIDIYVQPSYQEGLCRAILEAMSRACPVIASDVGGNKELVNESLLFHKGNEKEIEKKLLLVHDMNLHELARENFNIAKKYSTYILNDRRDKFYHEHIKRKEN